MSDNTPVPDDEAVCFLREELNSLRARNVSLKAKVEWFEREQQIWHSNMAALRARVQGKCPIGLDATPDLCSAGTCAECDRRLRSRADAADAFEAEVKHARDERDVIARQAVDDHMAHLATKKQAEALATALEKLISKCEAANSEVDDEITLSWPVLSPFQIQEHRQLLQAWRAPASGKRQSDGD